MPNIFSRLRGLGGASNRNNTQISLHSNEITNTRTSTSAQASQQPHNKQHRHSNWGPGVRGHASRFLRHSTTQRTDSSDPEAGQVGKKEPIQQAGLKNPWLIFRRSILSSWINVLLLLVPVGIASHPAHFPDIAVFIINFFAIIPLAKILGYATEQLALHLGEALGGLLNATFGNAVELLVGILALVKGKIEIVQTSLVGSILSNLLLVGGCCFFFGGLKNNEQVFSEHAAQSYGSLLAMAILASLLPAAYNSLNAKDAELKSGTLTLSHVTAIFLLIVYIAYLYFQLKTHSNLFSAVPLEERKLAARKPAKAGAPKEEEGGSSSAEITADATAAATAAPPSVASSRDPILETNTATVAQGTPADRSHVVINDQHEEEIKQVEEKVEEEDEGDEEPEEAELTILASMLLLAIITGLTGVCAEFLVSSIDGLTTKWNLSPSFVGMILLPIVGNAAEHVTAVTVAIRNKMDLAMGVAVGSSIQIALFVLPFLCILGWIIDQPMTIYFSPFTTVVLFVTVLLVNYIIGDGRTNWLEGLLLIVAYIIIGVAYFLYPKDMDTSNSKLTN